MALRRMLAPSIVPAYLSSAARIVRRRARGHRRFPGDAAAVCRAVIDACWTGQYLAASGGHFRQFWTRDLGFSASALVRLGWGERVRASAAWALDAWAARGQVTTTIFGPRRPADVYTYGVDSLPFLLRTLEVADGESLVRRHGSWLASEVRRFGALVIDPATGLVRDDRRFSTHRDTVWTRSNAYANTMVCLLDAVLRRTGWFPSPVPDGAVERFVGAFWRTDHFGERRTGEADLVTGDGNVFPFWLGLVPDELGLAAALRAMDAAGLARPLPLRYVGRRDAGAEDRVQRLFVPDYQGTAIWTSLGGMYLSLVARVDAAAAAAGLAAYARLIERDGTLWEVVRDDLLPYRGRLSLFVADEAMLWAAILLEQLEPPRTPSGQ